MVWFASERVVKKTSIKTELSHSASGNFCTASTTLNK